MKRCVYLLILAALGHLPGVALSSSPAPLPLRLYSQSLEITYPSAEEAASATLEFAPVYDARDWAFSARWDDCNLNSLQMRQHMAKFGLKGNFYLTQNDHKNRYGPEFCKELVQDGCAIGGHSMTHPKLTGLNAGAIWWELLANRVAREDDTETTLNSLAFPYGQYRGSNSGAFPVISEAVRRAGYHHCVYAEFVRNNPHLAPGEFSTGCQVVPGDRVVNAETFRAQLDKPLRAVDSYRAWTHCIFLGVHPWQTGEEWNKLDAIYQTLAENPRWWYCSQTEWAAYARQVSRSVLKPEPGETASPLRRYALSRPVPGELGAAVPLTCVVRGAPVKAVLLDGQPASITARGDTVVLNLPHGPGVSLPQRIGHIEVPADSQALSDELQCKDFPGLKACLAADGHAVKLTLSAPPREELSDLHIRFRLPLQFEPGILVHALDRIRAGTRQEIEMPLPAAKGESFWAEGPRYWAAEIDFTGAQGSARLFVTRLEPE